MSKNLTRKGLAFGAVAALASTLFAGAPAQAAGENITLTSSVGTSFKTLLGGSFELSSVFSGFTVAPSNLKYLVTGVGASEVTAKALAGTARKTKSDFTAASAAAVNDNNANALATRENSQTITGVYSAASTSQVQLSLAGVAATTKITVTAFLDNVNADNVISAGEVKSSPVEITFVKLSEVTATTVAVTPKIGSAQTVTAKVTLGDINLQQAENSALTTVIFQQNGSGSTVVQTAWDADEAALVATSAGFTVAAGNVFTAQAYLNSVKSGTAAVALPEAGATTITTGSAAPVSTPSENIVASGSDYFVRVGTTSFTATSSAEYTDANGVVAQAAPAGVKAKVTIGYAGLASAAAKVTAGGKSVTKTSTADATFDAVTDATGSVVVPVTTSGMKQNDYVIISVSYQSKTDWTVAASTRYTYKDAAISAVGLVNAGDARVAVKKSGTYSVAYKLADQFGAGISTATATDSVKRQLKVTASGTGHTFAKQFDFVNGIATATITDDASAAGTFAVDVTLVKLDSGSTTVFGTNDGSNDPANFDVYIGDATPGYMSLDTLATTKKSVSYKTFVSVNTALDTIPTAVSTETSDYVHTFSGTVLNSDGTVGSGLPVVISGAGLQFKKGTVWATDKITVIATATGTFSVDVYSHKAGKQTVTATAGSVSKTGTLEWAVAPENKGSVIAITAPSFAGVGTTVNISVLLTDKWGNAVKTTQGVSRANTFSVAVSGTAGITGTIPAETDANGTLKFYQLIGSNDAGTFTVTVKYDADGASTTEAEITKTATVTIGKAPVAGATAAIAGSTKRFFVSVDGNSSARNVVVKVAGKTFRTLKGATAKKTYLVAAPKGSHKVTVFVGGKLIATKTIVVK